MLGCRALSCKPTAVYLPSVYNGPMAPSTVVPLPLVSRRVIVAAYDPLHAGSAKGRFQALRANLVVSSGIRRPFRSARGRVAGTLHLYSVLNREAVCLYRQGDVERARSLAEQATALEHRDEAQLLVDALAALQQTVAVRGDFEWPPIEQLMGDTQLGILLTHFAEVTEGVSATFRTWQAATQSITGIVQSVQDALAVIETLRGDVLFPLSHLTQLSLDRVGAGVELQWEELESKRTLVSVSPGLTIPGHAKQELRSPYASEAPPQLSEARWAHLRSLREIPPSELPPLPIQLPAA